LDLRFADNKTLGDAYGGGSPVTFTRASTGRFVGSDGLIQTAAVDAPRFDHNPTTGESLGLLVEEARTNNLLQSEDFSSTWTLSNIAVTANSVVAPDGTTTADTIAPPVDGLTVTRLLRQNPVLTTQQAYTLSVFVKVGTATTNGIALYVSDSTATNIFRANFNLSNLTTATGNTGWAVPTATIVPYPNGWYRCILTGVTSTVHISLRAQIYLNIFGTTPDTYGTHHIWGAQLEAGAFATSYIPTTTATVTRAADVASIAGTNFSSWYNQTEGTVFTDCSINYTVPGSLFPLISSLNDGTSNNRIENGFLTASLAGYEISASGSAQVGVYPNASSALTRRLATTYQLNNFAASVNGGSVSTDTSGIVPTVNQLRIGDRVTGGTQSLNGTIRRLTYWPVRLSNTTLQQITRS
jgi:hypothetical protein